MPPWFSARTLRGQVRTRQGYQVPPMPWALDAAERDRIRALSPDIVALRDVAPPRGRGLTYGRLFPFLNRVRAIRALGVTGLPIVRADFTPAAGSAAPPSGSPTPA